MSYVTIATIIASIVVAFILFGTKIITFAVWLVMWLL